MAMPGMVDLNFSQSVTCICEHSPDGAMGLIINRTHARITARSIFDELEVEYLPTAESIPIHIGGPVHMHELFILHGPPFGWHGCLMITETIAMSNTRDILKAIAFQKGPASFLLTLGCAGWGPGQLESEVKANAWLTDAVDHQIIFETPDEEIWEKAVKKIGINPAFLSSTAGHA